MKAQAHHPSWKPWPAVVLAVDPGKRCGVCLAEDGVRLDSGHGDGYDHAWIAAWIERAVELGQRIDRPVVLVLEKPPIGGRGYGGRNAFGAGSVCGSRNVWQREWSLKSGAIKSRVVSVEPHTWRIPLGIARLAKGVDRAAVEIRLAGGDCTADEAAARLIGRWAARAGAVGKVLPKGRRKKKGAVW